MAGKEEPGFRLPAIEMSLFSCCASPRGLAVTDCSVLTAPFAVSAHAADLQPKRANYWDLHDALFFAGQYPAPNLARSFPFRQDLPHSLVVK